MAKIITPPQIEDLDGLLELVVNPQKGIAYMKQLKEMRDAIVELLGTYQSQEKATVLLAQAQTKHTEATKTLQDAEACMAKTQQDCDAMCEKVKALQAQAAKEHEAAQAAVAARERAFREHEQRVLSKEKEILQRERAMQEAQDVLTRRKKDLDIEFEKMMKRKAVLSEIG